MDFFNITGQRQFIEITEHQTRKYPGHQTRKIIKMETKKAA